MRSDAETLLSHDLIQPAFARANPPRDPLLTPLQVLDWIAGNRLHPCQEIYDRDFVSQWVGDRFGVGAILEALDARSALEPFCAVQRVFLDGLWAEGGYSHRALSPKGPALLRSIRRRARQRQGRLVSYAEMATELRTGLDALAREDAARKRAKPELLSALRAGTLTAWGKRERRCGANPGATHEAIPPGVFMDDLVTVTEWGTVGTDRDNSMAFGKYNEVRFYEVRFYTAKVLTIWPTSSRTPVDAGRKSSTNNVTVSVAALRDWYIKRRDEWPGHRKHPSQDDDWIEAKAHFAGKSVGREAIRSVRKEHAPQSWTDPGRRKLARE